MNEFSISTSWNSLRHSDALGMINEIKSSGFFSVELNFKLTKDIVDSFLALVKDNQIKIVSLHNYCPLPDGITKSEISPDCYSLASPDEDERRKAILYTKQTIEYTHKLGAKATVLHCGKVQASDYSKNLMTMYRDGKKDSTQFVQVRDGMFKDRNQRSKAYLENLLKSLDDLSSFASEKNVMLGIENRCYFMEIPSFEEIAIILQRFKGSPIRYWHDVGHAQIFQELGFAWHIMFLEGYADDMAGIHLHDIKGVDDHLAPGNGEFNFHMLKPYLKNEVIKVVEPHATETAHDIAYAKKYLTEIFDT